MVQTETQTETQPAEPLPYKGKKRGRKPTGRTTKMIRVPLWMEEKLRDYMDVLRYCSNELSPLPPGVLDFMGKDISLIEKYILNSPAPMVLQYWAEENAARLGRKIAHRKIAFFSSQLADILLPTPKIGQKWWQILGVGENATLQEAKAAYRKKCLEWHPDKNKDPDAEDCIKAVNWAWEQFKKLHRA